MADSWRQRGDLGGGFGVGDRVGGQMGEMRLIPAVQLAIGGRSDQTGAE